MHAVLFYTAAIAFACGIFIRSFSSAGLPAILCMMIVAGVLAGIWFRKPSEPSAPHILTCSVLIFFAALGMLRMEWATWNETDPYLESKINTEITVEGIIVREPDVRDTTTHLYVAADEQVLLIITDRYTAYAYGDHVEVTGQLLQPEPFETDLGRTFNYRGYLLAQGAAYMMIYADITHISSGNGNAVIASLLSIKHTFMQTIEQILPEPHVGLGEGLLLGVKRALGEELETIFRKTGIIHIVVLSGYNIMLVVVFVMYLFAYLFEFRLRILFGVLSIVAFALIVGLSATVVRASIMASLLLIARATGQTPAIMRTLLFAGCVMLIFNPYLLAFDTGFQLSFLATMGLILVAPYIEERLTLVPSQIGVREFLTATLATQIFVLPILLYQIGEFSAVSVLVNVLVLPMVPVAMLLTFATGLTGMVSATLALPFAYLAYLSLEYILVIATWFAALPFAAYTVPAFSFWFVPFIYAFMGYGIWLLWTKNKPESQTDIAHGWTIVDEREIFGVR